ncbi:nuclear transport factor 2 family protein [Streptomyces sp. WMMB 322]|uniref:nuclear transport factor 2 family protein n=1 Tax=Streptomyces sp. WMMB 322 TaxID=1286821 RepID=UPI000823B1BB|nr:nuclear transport factor 2 family protein [Streptomyces sp. WMMB 322]SCK28466.1 SnoaL-like domain-containing protein [Streptomyces sp. WMMB 322]
MPGATGTEVVRACMESYIAQDRERAERLIADDYRFTSPQDDHIDRDAFFERCFPTAERFRWQEILAVVPAGGDDVFLLYEYELRTGERHRNVEVATVRDGRITETQVFFGGRVR